MILNVSVDRSFPDIPVVTMNTQVPMRVAEDGTKPDSIATAGNARIPAPTVVPATKVIALNS